MEEMIALKDIGETIKAGDEVSVHYSFESPFIREVFENKEGWVDYDTDLGKIVYDESKRVCHRFEDGEVSEYFRKLTDEEKIVGKCESCECELSREDKYLSNGDNNVFYCEDCFSSYSVTYFEVDGEHIGVSDDGWDVN